MRSWAAHPSRVVVTVTLLLALAHAGGLLIRESRARLVRGDAVHYYVYLRSLVFDGDLSFENDYVMLYGLDFPGGTAPADFPWEFERTPTGLVRNYMAVGTPIVWAPVFLAVAMGAGVLHRVGIGAAPDGLGLAFQLVPDLCGLVAAGLALWFVFLLAREVVRPGRALWAALATLAGTSFLYYALVAPSYSHAVSAMAASGYFLVWWRTRDDSSLRRYAIVGALGGLTALVRWQDAIVLVTLAVDVWGHAGAADRSIGRRLAWAAGRLAAAAAAAGLAFSPQYVVWGVLYGRAVLVPQGDDFMRWSSPKVLEVLLSPMRGLFSWTPLAALGVAGLVPLFRTHRRLAVGLGLFLAGSVYVNASVADWWAGEAFGARRFLSCLPVFVTGLAVLLDRPGRAARIVAAATAVLVAANLFLLLYYEVFMLGYRQLVQYPDNWYALWIDRFLLPLRLLARLAG